ncbi:MAG: HlyD family type I secretion periplasmic adaptor subunit [Rhodospirillaceae bacterium]|nr:HlyD family type I secretion periplasmic adaptor subunit [Rhodospirillaceae bacterium]
MTNIASPVRPLALPLPQTLPHDPLPERPEARGAVRLGALVLLAFLLALASWSYWAPLTEAAMADGEIRAEGQRRTLSHLEGGIIARIHVREGDRVRAGQTLITLGDTGALADADALRHERWALLAQAARLEAEERDRAAVVFPAALLARTDSVSREAVAGQRRLFAIRRENLQNQRALFEARITQHRASIDALNGGIDAQRIQLSLLEQEEKAASHLLNQGLQRMPAVLALRRSIAMTRGGIASDTGNIAREAASIGEIEQTLRQIDSDFRQLAAEDRQRVDAKLAQNAERLRAAEDVLARRELRAPEAGRVFDLRYVTEGSVIERGAPILDIVPAGDRLVAEVKVQPTDIEMVHGGLTAQVRLTGLVQRNAPYLEGRVSFVAADVTQPNRGAGASYYRAQVTLDPESLKRLDGVDLVAGMPVQVMIKTGERSMFDYLSRPLVNSFNRAFHEP